MDKQDISGLYDTLNMSGASLCLYPNMTCREMPIKAHSIQNSTVFDLLSRNSHLIGLKIKPNKSHIPEIFFDRIGRNMASTFEGFCEKHDEELFRCIDKSEFDANNYQQLFLLAYRSVAKEVHASMSKAIKMQTGYLQKREKNPVKDESISDWGLFVTQCIIDAIDTYQYKCQLDEALLSQDFLKLTHRIFEIKTTEPKLACSQLFSIDSVRYKNSVSKVIMNVFPANSHLTYAIFSSTIEEKELADEYLYKCVNSHSELRNYEISKMVIRNSENFFINPNHFNTWNEQKKNKILIYLADTIFKDKDQDDVDFYLF